MITLWLIFDCMSPICVNLIFFLWKITKIYLFGFILLTRCKWCEYRANMDLYIKVWLLHKCGMFSLSRPLSITPGSGSVFCYFLTFGFAVLSSAIPLVYFWYTSINRSTDLLRDAILIHSLHILTKTFN